jgi:hypothetical protein
MNVCAAATSSESHARKAASVGRITRIALRDIDHFTLAEPDAEIARVAVSNMSAVTADANGRPYSCDGIVLIPTTAGEKHEDLRKGRQPERRARHR